MMNKVSAILVTYKRPNELRQIVKVLGDYPFIDEILVRDNEVESENLKCYGRYVMAQQARNEWLYMQDDDCIVKNIWQMYELFDGSQFVNAIKIDRMSFYSGRDSLLGWGAFLCKSWISVLDKYIAKYGEDMILKREADRIFTSLLGVPKRTVVANVTDFPCAMDPKSLSLQPDHFNFRNLAINRCKEILKNENSVVSL